MTDQQPEHAEVSSFRKERLFFVTVIVLLGVLAFFFYSRRQPPASETETKNVELQQELANVKQLLLELKTAELYREEEQELSKSRTTEASQAAQDASAAIDDLQEATRGWESAVKDLLGSDKGKRLAANPEALEQFHALKEQKRPASDLASQLRRRLEGTMRSVTRALETKNTAYSPTEEVFSRIQDIRTQAQSAAEIYRAHHRQLEAILARCPSEPAADTPTLSAALDALQQKWDAEKARIAAEVLGKVRAQGAREIAQAQAEAEQKIAKAEADAKRRLGEIEASRVVKETEKALEEARLRKKKEAAAAAKAALEREFEKDLPEIQSLLRPFITKGRTQPYKRSFEMTTEIGPVSLAKLQATGAPNRTVEAQELLWGMTTANRTNDRDLGGFPAFIGGARDWREKQPTMQRAQELLNKYGELMVEKGLLAP
jgi:hypothetical protein